MQQTRKNYVGREAALPEEETKVLTKGRAATGAHICKTTTQYHAF